MPRIASKEKGTAVYQSTIPTEAVEGIRSHFGSDSDSKAIASAVLYVYETFRGEQRLKPQRPGTNSKATSTAESFLFGDDE